MTQFLRLRLKMAGYGIPLSVLLFAFFFGLSCCSHCGEFQFDNIFACCVTTSGGMVSNVTSYKSNLFDFRTSPELFTQKMVGQSTRCLLMGSLGYFGFINSWCHRVDTSLQYCL